MAQLMIDREEGQEDDYGGAQVYGVEMEDVASDVRLLNRKKHNV